MRRRVIVVTEAVYNTIMQTLEYVIEDAGQADYDGDHNEADCRRFERALEAVKDSPARDVIKDCDAIQEMARTACMSACSCVSRPKHAVDCWVTTHGKETDRAFEVAGVLVDRLPRGSAS